MWDFVTIWPQRTEYWKFIFGHWCWCWFDEYTTDAAAVPSRYKNEADIRISFQTNKYSVWNLHHKNLKELWDFVSIWPWRGQRSGNRKLGSDFIFGRSFICRTDDYTAVQETRHERSKHLKTGIFFSKFLRLNKNMRYNIGW